jgi:ribose transport system ATP-binding protein
VTAVADRTAKAQNRLRGRTRGARLLGGEYLPSLVIVALILGVGLVTGVQNDRFLSPLSIFNLLMLASVTALAGYGQSGVLMTGGIDLSIGPTISIAVVLASFYGGASASPGTLVGGLLLTVVVGIGVGAVNAALIRRIGLPAVLATLVSGIVLQGAALLLRPTPEGTIDGPIAQLSTVGSGSLPFAFLGVLLIGVGLEVASRFSRWGIELRASGSSEQKARSLGAGVERSMYAGYILSGLSSAVAGIILASVVGVGDASTGLSYTLVTVTAAVLGGTSVFGGRGSFIGVVFATLLLQELSSATTFLRLGIAWQQWLPAILIIVGAATFSRIRRSQGTA